MSAGRQPWGWHRLDDTWAQRIVAAAAPGPDDLVLDLGAGTGALTRPLLASGARVVAVELHAGRADRLRAFDDDRLTVVQADVLDVPLPRRPFRVVSSLPYRGSSDVLARLLARDSQLVTAHLVVQRELARRFVDGRAPGASRWQWTFELEIRTAVPRRAFRPPPRVDSVVLEVTRRGRLSRAATATSRRRRRGRSTSG